MNLNLYAIIAVVFRTAGVIMILQAVYAALISLLLRVSDGFQFVVLTGLLIPVIAGLVLWFIAKPVARVVTSGL